MTTLKSLSFRAAIRDDLPAIVRLLADDGLGRNRERPGEPPHPAYEQAFDRMTAQPGNLYLLAETDDGVIGCLQLTIIHGLSRACISRRTNPAPTRHASTRGWVSLPATRA